MCVESRAPVLRESRMWGGGRDKTWMRKKLTTKDLCYLSHRKKSHPRQKRVVIWTNHIQGHGWTRSPSEGILSDSSGQWRISWKHRCGLDVKQKGILGGLSKQGDGDKVAGAFQAQWAVADMTKMMKVMQNEPHLGCPGPVATYPAPTERCFQTGTLTKKHSAASPTPTPISSVFISSLLFISWPCSEEYARLDQGISTEMIRKPTNWVNCGKAL